MCPSAHRDLFRTAPRRLALARRGAIFRDQGEFIENLRSFTPTTPAEDEPATERSFFGGPVDAKVDAQAVAEAAADALFAASLPSEHADAFISHAWRDDATLKWLALCYTSNLFGAVVAASIVWLLLVVGLLGAVGYDVTAYGGATWLKVPCFAAWQTARGSRRTLRRRQGLGRDRRIASIRLGRARRLGDSLGTSTRLDDGRDGSTTGATRRPGSRRRTRPVDAARRQAQARPHPRRFSVVPAATFFAYFFHGHAMFGRTQRWWIDKLCIHQTRHDLKLAAIRELPSYVARSERLVVLHSESYFSRLWCTDPGVRDSSGAYRGDAATRIVL